MELAEANRNFGFMVIFTWVIGFVGYIYEVLIRVSRRTIPPVIECESEGVRKFSEPPLAAWEM